MLRASSVKMCNGILYKKSKHLWKTTSKMLTVFELSSEELDKLNYERYHYPCPLVQKRLHCLYVKATSGLSNEKVGKLMDAHRNSISEWVHLYRQGGFEATISVSYGTNQSVLENQADSIKELFAAHPPRSLAEAALKVKELTGIQRSATCLRSFMRRHQFRFLQTGHIPAKVNNTQQHQWVDSTLKPAIDAAHKGEVHLLFMDAAHFTLQPFICCLWCIARIFIKASPGRNRINVLGAVNALTKEVTTYTNTTYICANCLITFLKQLKEKYNDKPIAIILDNARYQHCFLVTTFAKSLGIHLLFLPPYSPNLNIIERLWKFTKKQILNAQYYEAPKMFHEAVINFFERINENHNAELHKLLTLEFQFFDKNIAHSYAA
jgi:transposase